MWAVTGWALATWLKTTVLLAVLVGLAWFVYGTGSGWFWAAVLGRRRSGAVRGPAARPGVVLRGAVVVVVGAVTGQTDLFGNPVVGLPEQRRRRSESNDVDLMHTVAGNAGRCGYVLVGAAERVYVRTDRPGEVQRVPRYEEDAVHQLLRRRWLTTGSAQDVTCGAASLRGSSVLVPKDTRARVERWNRLQRPPSWPRTTPTPDDPAVPTSGRVVRLHDRKKRP